MSPGEKTIVSICRVTMFATYDRHGSFGHLSSGRVDTTTGTPVTSSVTTDDDSEQSSSSSLYSTVQRRRHWLMPPGTPADRPTTAYVHSFTISLATDTAISDFLHDDRSIYDPAAVRKAPLGARHRPTPRSSFVVHLLLNDVRLFFADSHNRLITQAYDIHEVQAWFDESQRIFDSVGSKELLTTSVSHFQERYPSLLTALSWHTYIVYVMFNTFALYQQEAQLLLW